MPLSSESAKTLDQVKKSGRPCRFVMVSKGMNSVITVVAYRRGTEESRIREAKQEGAGKVSCGVVDGQGADLTFKLLRSEGYEEVPVKPMALRAFFVESSDLGLKPKIEIVDELPAVEGEGGLGQTQQIDFRSGDEWRTVIQTIHGTAEEDARSELLAQAIRDALSERQKIQQHLNDAPDSQEAREAEINLEKVINILKKLRPQAPPPNVPPPRPNVQRDVPPPDVPPPPPPRRQQPDVDQQQGQVRAPQRPQNPPPPVPNPFRAKLTELQTQRDGIRNDLRQRIEVVTHPRQLFDDQDIARILEECETDGESEFGQICSEMKLDLFKNRRPGEPWVEKPQIDGGVVDRSMQKLIALKEAALAYIKGHKDPKIGKLPSRVRKRREYCQRFIDEIDSYIVSIGEKNNTVQELCETSERKVQAGEYVSPEVISELKSLLLKPLLTNDVKKKIRDTLKLVAQESQRMGYEELDRAQNLTEMERIELMEAYGCGTKPLGGTSDVKLLRDRDGNILYALKSANKESEQALESLGLPNGACAMREDLASTIFEKFFEINQIDLGFPKSRLMKVNGQPVAVIDGIPGRMSDREALDDIDQEMGQLRQLQQRLVQAGRPQEEIQEIEDQLARLEQRLESTQQELEDVPNHVSSKSMGKVLMSSILTGQWDLKWGNMIVEGDTARPIDAGAALPTLKVIDSFLSGDRQSLFGLPALEQLLQYPRGHSQQFTDLPIANDPVDQELVDAMLNINVDELVQAAKDKRAKLQQDFPDLGGGVPLVEDVSFDIMRDSILGTQAILRNRQPITLKEFVQEWSNWFTNWAPGFYRAKAPPE